MFNSLLIAVFGHQYLIANEELVIMIIITSLVSVTILFYATTIGKILDDSIKQIEMDLDTCYIIPEIDDRGFSALEFVYYTGLSEIYPIIAAFHHATEQNHVFVDNNFDSLVKRYQDNTK